MPEFVAITPERLAATVAEDAVTRPGPVLVAVDGAEAADPLALARSIVDAVRERARPAEAVALRDYIRPASLRLEHGRTDEMSYRTAWFDYAAVRREVVDALRERGRWLPALWDGEHDRSARAAVRTAAPGTVLVLAGPMLAGRDLAPDVSVRLVMSEAALRRRTPAEDHWTIPALLDHARENPDPATYSLRWDHPDRPALVR
ncbi:hypothetical protein ACWEKT_25890 [Nocardia takedensis]